MGYRHYLYVLEQENLSKLEILLKDMHIKDEKYDWYKASSIDAPKYCDAKEILELGNYSEEGFELCEVPRELHPWSNLITKVWSESNDSEHGFNILLASDIQWLAQQYMKRTKEYWEQLLGKKEIPSYYEDYNRTVEERCINYVEDLLRWEKYMCNIDLNNLWELQTTWKYEFEMFNILHILKKLDWNKQCIMIVGY